MPVAGSGREIRSQALAAARARARARAKAQKAAQAAKLKAAAERFARAHPNPRAQDPKPASPGRRPDPRGLRTAKATVGRTTAETRRQADKHAERFLAAVSGGAGTRIVRAADQARRFAALQARQVESTPSGARIAAHPRTPLEQRRANVVASLTDPARMGPTEAFLGIEGRKPALAAVLGAAPTEGNALTVAARQLADSLLYTPAGLYYLGRAAAGDTRDLFTEGDFTPERTGRIAQDMVHSIADDFRHPLRNAGYLAADILGAAGGIAGTASRVSTAARVAGRGGGTRAVARALVHGPGPQARQISPDVAVPRSRSALGRTFEDVGRRVGLERVGPGLSFTPESRVGFERGRHERIRGEIETSRAQGLRRTGRRTPAAAQAAIRAVAEGTPLDLRIRRHQDDIAKAQARISDTTDRKQRARLTEQIRRIQGKIRTLEKARDAGYVIEGPDGLRVSPELERAYGLTRASSQRGEATDIRLGRLDPDQADIRTGAPGRFIRGGEHVTPDEAARRADALNPDIESAYQQVRLNERDAARVRAQGLPEVRQAGSEYGQAHHAAVAAWRKQERLRPLVAKVRALQDELILIDERYREYVGRELSDPDEMRTLRNLKERMDSVSAELGRRLPVLERYHDAVDRELQAREAGASALEGLQEARGTQARILGELRAAAEDADLEFRQLAIRQQEIEGQTGWVGGEGGYPADFFTTYSSKRPRAGTGIPGNDQIMGAPRLTGHQQFTGESIRQGTFRDDIMQATADTELARLGDSRKLRIWETAKSESITVDEWRALPAGERKHYRPVRTTLQAYTPESRRFLQDLYEQRDSGMPLTRAERKEMRDLEQDLFGHMFPATRTALVDTEGQLRMFDKRTMPEKRLTPRTDPTSRFASGVGGAADVFNQLASMSLLFTKGPGYVIPNTLGMAAMATIHQGLRAAWNMVRAGELVARKLTPDQIATLRGSTGTGLAHSLGPAKSASDLVSRVHGKVADAYGTVLDDPWRFGGFVHEARRYGYRTTEDIQRLLDAQDGTPEFRDLMLIRQEVDRAYGEFGRMGHVERDVIRRLVFFYPWLKASTMYTARLPIDKPVTTAALVQVGRYGQGRTEEMLGPGVSSQLGPGMFPTGDVDADGNPRVIDPRAVALFQSPSDIASIIGDFASGEGVSRSQAANLGAYLTPAASIALAVGLRYDPFFERTYPDDMSRRDIAYDQLRGLTPYTRLHDRLQEPGVHDGSIFGFSRGDAWKQVFAGSESPRTLNIAEARDRAEEDARAALSPPQRTTRSHKQFRQELLDASHAVGHEGPLPKDVADAVMWRGRRNAAYARAHEKRGMRGDESLPQIDRLRIDLDLLVRRGDITRQRARDVMREHAADTPDQISSLRSTYISPLFGSDALSEWRAGIKDAGGWVPAYPGSAG